MVMLNFICSNPLAGTLESSVSGPDIEFCLDLFSTLIGLGWEPIHITLAVGNDSAIVLPTEAFDGAQMSEPIQSLHQQWIEQLYQH